MLFAFDLAIVAMSLVSGWLWYLASRNRLRRLSRDEVLDAADINRMIVTMNRTQILNARAAVATACAAMLAALRFALDAVMLG